MPPARGHCQWHCNMHRRSRSRHSIVDQHSTPTRPITTTQTPILSASIAPVKAASRNFLISYFRPLSALPLLELILHVPIITQLFRRNDANLSKIVTRASLRPSNPHQLSTTRRPHHGTTRRRQALRDCLTTGLSPARGSRTVCRASFFSCVRQSPLTADLRFSKTGLVLPDRGERDEYGM